MVIKLPTQRVDLRRDSYAEYEICRAEIIKYLTAQPTTTSKGEIVLKAFIKLIVLLPGLLFLFGCEEDTQDYAADIIDTYIVVSITAAGDTYDLTDLPLEQTFFITISRTMVTFYENDEDPCLDTYLAEADAIDEVTETKILMSDGSEVTYTMVGNSLQITDGEDVMVLEAYTGTVPPAIWTDPSLLPNDTYEPDNTMAMATTIAAGGTLQNHYLGICDDVDYFMFAAQAGISYIMETTTTDYPDLDMTLTLYSGNGSEIASDDDSGTGWNPNLSWTCEVSGDYYFVVEGYWFGEYGAYSVSVMETQGLVKRTVPVEQKKLKLSDRACPSDFFGQ